MCVNVSHLAMPTMSVLFLVGLSSELRDDKTEEATSIRLKLLNPLGITNFDFL